MLKSRLRAWNLELGFRVRNLTKGMSAWILEHVFKFDNFELNVLNFRACMLGFRSWCSELKLGCES